MFFRRIKTPALAHNAYILGQSGEAAVIDPRRDVDEYLRIARDAGLVIKYVIETHKQEDFILGSAELSRITGAKIVNGAHKDFGHGDIRLRDGERFEFGNLALQALHTPGHTPESTSYAIFVKETPGRAWGVFTGDALFIGGTGRTDLIDPKKTAENAGLLYDSVHQKILPLGDQALVFPAHGTGTVCGVGLADRDDSTIGLERAYNKVFVSSRDAFIAEKVHAQIPLPPYFGRPSRHNAKGGLPLAGDPNAVRILEPEIFALETKGGLVIDTRSPEAFAGGHIPGSLSIGLGGLGVYAGWIADESTRVFLVLDEPEDLVPATLALARIGIDKVEGALAGGFASWRNAGLPIGRISTMGPKELSKKLSDYAVLDVRAEDELEATGRIRGAKHIYVGHLDERLAELKKDWRKDKPIAVTCSVGNRGSMAASILARHGYTHVTNLLGGMKAWIKQDLPVAREPELTRKAA